MKDFVSLDLRADYEARTNAVVADCVTPLLSLFSHTLLGLVLRNFHDQIKSQWRSFFALILANKCNEINDIGSPTALPWKQGASLTSLPSLWKSVRNMTQAADVCRWWRVIRLSRLPQLILIQWITLIKHASRVLCRTCRKIPVELAKKVHIVIHA